MPTTATRLAAHPMVVALVSLVALGVPTGVAQQRVGPSGHFAMTPPPTLPTTCPAGAIPMPVDAAARVLSGAQMFAGSHVGYAATEPTEYAAFRVILAQPDAADRFGRLARSTNTASQLFGLLGLRRVDPKRYAVAVAGHERSNAPVTTFFFCFKGRDTVGKVIASWGPLPADPYQRSSDPRPTATTRP